MNNFAKNKPNNFELIELLFRDKVPIRSDISSNPKLSSQLEDFVTRFQSFINQIPSYCHSVEKPGFFTHYWFGAFSTVLDTKLNSEKLGIQKLHFSFDDATTLKVVAKTEQGTHLFIFNEDIAKNDFSFSQNEWRSILGYDPTPLEKSKLKIDLINIRKDNQGIHVERDNKKNIYKDYTSSIRNIHYEEIKPNVNKKIYVEYYIEKLANARSNEVDKYLNNFLEHITKVHTTYSGIPYGSGQRVVNNKKQKIIFSEANQHGFLTGALMNYKYRYNAKIYLEQFSGRGSSDIVALFRGPDRISNAIPIVFELKSGNVNPTVGLDQTQKYTTETTRLLTTSNIVVAAALSFDFIPKDVNDILSTIDNSNAVQNKEFLKNQVIKSDHIENKDHILKYIDQWYDNKERLKNEIKNYIKSDCKFISNIKTIEKPAGPLIEHILDNLNDWNRKKISEDKLKQNLKDVLAREYDIFPGTKESKQNQFFSKYILGESILVNKFGSDKDHVKKYLFSYSESPLEDAKVRPVKPIGPPVTLENNPVTTLAFVRGNDGNDKTAFVFHIKENNTKDFLSNKKIPNIPEIGTVKNVVEIHLSLSRYEKGASFDDLFNIPQ